MSRDVKRRDVIKGAGAAGAAGAMGTAGCLDFLGGGDGGDGSDGGPDTLIVIGYPASGVQLFKDYYSEHSGDLPILVTDGLRDTSLPDDVGNDMSNVSGTAPAPSGPGADAFTSRYEDEYGGEPGVFTAHTYDAVALLLLANAAAGSNQGTAVRDQMRAIANPQGENFGPDNLAEAVEAAASGTDVNYQGASSSTNFDDKGDMSAVTYELFSFGSDGITTEDTIDFSGDAPSASADYAGSDTSRPLKVGILLPQTGDLADLGGPMTQAGELAAMQVDSESEFTVDWQVEDSQTDSNAGISAANSLVNAGYPAIAGPASSGVNLPVSNQVYIPNQVVGCSPSSTSPNVTTLQDDDYVYRTAPSDTLQGKVLAQVAYDNKDARSASTMYVNNDYGQALSQSFANAFGEKGGSVGNQVSFEKEQSSYTSKLSEALQ